MEWKNIIKDLREIGLTQLQIARAVGVSQATVSDLSSGLQKSVNYSLGKNLVAYHKRQTRAYARKVKSEIGQTAKAG